MNILKKVHDFQFNKGMSRYEKYLESTKRAALETSWNPEELKKNYELDNEGYDWFINKRWLTEAGSKFSLPPFSPSNPAEFAIATVKGIKTKILLDRRRKYWNNVFASISDEITPSLAGHEYFLSEKDDLSDWVSVATFPYPSAGVFESRHGFDKEFQLGDYELYERLTSKLKERIGMNLVYVQPVGKVSEDGADINGTIGDKGFRIWIGEGDGLPLFHENEDADSLWSRNLKYSALVVSPIQRLEGLRNTSLEGATVAVSPEVEGTFHILTVASETVTAQEYMARADEIREAIGVPGLMVSNSIQARPEEKEGFFYPSSQTAGANEDGVHYTTFTFYSGNETEVKISEVNTDESGAPASVVSGFMPIHSANSIPRKRKPRQPVAV